MATVNFSFPSVTLEQDFQARNVGLTPTLGTLCICMDIEHGAYAQGP